MEEDKEKIEAKESTESSLEYRAPEETLDSTPAAQPQETVTPAQKNNKPSLKNRLGSHWTIYIPIFVVLLIGLVVAAILLYKNQNSNKSSVSEQNLSASQLSNLASANSTIGSSNQVLTVQSSAIFSNQVLVRGQLQVAGQLQISQLAVSKNLSIAGDTSIQGGLTVQNGLSVNGSGTFNGNLSATQITTGSLTLTGDLSLTHHLITNGSIPSRTTGAAAGSGGTVSVNGSDTAGTVTINTGNGPAAGCFINISFASAFGSTPHILLTPVGAESSTLSYYINRTSTGFSICSSNAPQAAQIYTFDYFVID